MRTLRVATRFVAAAVVSGAAALIGSILLPFAVGFTTSVVVSGSMEPNISVGDAIVGHRVEATDVRVGDILSFQDPEGTGKQITHRAISVQRLSSRVQISTKGDANNTVERFNLPPHGRIGLVSYRLPRSGFALVYLSHPAARIGLVTVPALLLLIVELVKIWRPIENRDVVALS